MENYKSPVLGTSGINNNNSGKQKYNITEIFVKAQGHWPWVLESLGVDPDFLTGKHGPCFNCGGIDRFRFDNKEGKGTFYCNQCEPHSGYGLHFVMRYFNCTRSQAIEKIGNLLQINPRPALTYTSHQPNQKIKEKTIHMIRKSEPADIKHPYLVKKNIHLNGLRVYKDSLLIEVYNGHKVLVSLQMIKPDGSKFYLKGTTKIGCYSTVGQHSVTDPCIITEGFATAVSLYLSLNIPIFIAFDCGNIKHALQTILNNFRLCGKIIVAADNDNNNAGLNAARDALESLNLPLNIIMPDRIGDDWNDVHVRKGRDSIRSAFKEILV
jgi:putative DNA primase/helicase